MSSAKMVNEDALEATSNDQRQFWEQIERILSHHDQSVAQATTSDTSILYTHLAHFYALCDAHYDSHLDNAQDCQVLVHRLLESPLIAHSPIDDCVETLSSLAVSATSLPTLYLLYETLYRLAARHANLFRSCATSKQLIPRLVHHFWAARFAEEYNQKHSDTHARAGSTSEHERDSSAETVHSNWHVEQVKSRSQGDSKRAMAEKRNRNVQIHLREQSVVLLYEICRSQRLSPSEIRPIDATFVNHLFELVELSRNWHDDAYNYKLIKLIVALNEQFMVSGIAAASSKLAPRKSTASASNTVLTVLRTRLNASKTFGENLIFMLNRASSLDAEDVCMQLLILKLLYLLFTTKETSHYFYTNDLKVLVDIFIRELSDLPDEHESLRHTYLRVFHPLLTNTQLLTYAYKRPQVRRLLLGLTSHSHFRDISATTQRLVDRCLSAQWCVDLDQANTPAARSTSLPSEQTSTQSPSKHMFSVQPIGGGPATLVEARVMLDSEGVAVPVDADDKPIQPTSSSQASTSVILKADDGVENNHPAAMYQSSPIITSRMADDGAEVAGGPSKRGRVRSIDGLPTHMHASVEELSYEAPAYPERNDARSLLGIDAARASHTSPMRVHSALDITKFGRGDQDSESDETEQWSGSVSSSWHQSMAAANEQEPCTTGKRGVHGESSYVPSPLRDSDESYYASSGRRASSGELGSVPSSIPQVQVRRSVDTESAKTADRKGSGFSRRRPPAPPTVAATAAVSSVGTGTESRRKANLRKFGLHASPSDTSLARHDMDENEANTDSEDHAALTAADRALRVTSATVSPDNGSANCSRTGSPEVNNEEDRMSSLIGETYAARRRRPPPPPVDRSTKSITRNQPTNGNGMPAASAPVIAEKWSLHHDTSSDDVPHVEREVSTAAHKYAHDDDADAQYATYAHQAPADDQNQRHLSQYMNHLHLSSSSGYGW